MSDFSLTLVLQIKTSKIINDMAKVSIKSEKINLDWQRLDNRKQCVISLSKPFTFTDKSTEEEQFRWFKDVTEKNISFFKPKIKNL